jgi:hypothetical protein
MGKKMQEKIIEAMNFNSKELKINMHDGTFTRLKAATFAQLGSILNVDNTKSIEQLREIKRELIELVHTGVLVEIESEPSFYLFADEFDRKIGSKSNVIGIEGFV